MNLIQEMILQNITNLQNSAANPSISAFVAASAGSGKTRVLTNRVLRLLLSGVSPEKILCLTFTKVGAAEMQQRILAELKNWAIISDDELKNNLLKLTNQNPSSLEIKKAKQLFITLLDSKNGLQISTIHSFCQNIIKQFPLESGASPNFTIIDKEKEKQLLFEARKKLLETALNNQNLADQINLISAQLNEEDFLSITAEIIDKRANIFDLTEQHFDIKGVCDAVFKHLNLSPQNDENEVFNDFISNSNWRKDALMSCLNQAQVKGKAIKGKEAIIQFIQNPDLENLNSYLQVFLTNKNEPRSKIITKEISTKFPEAKVLMLNEQKRIIEFLEKYNSSKIATKTSALLLICHQIIEIYNQLKRQNNYLDYNDLIIKTNALFKNSSNRDWIRYKLDGLYNHILVDESQDTNHYQWNIIKAISEDFFCSEEAKNNKSIFVVGDEKQSIYSFQGAEPEIFHQIFDYYQEKLKLIEQNFLQVKLNSSFRSLPSILKVVDAVFCEEKLTKAISKNESKIIHQAIKNHHPGKVELMPLVCKPNSDKKTEPENYDWKLDFAVSEEYQCKEILAQIIAKKISSFFKQKKHIIGNESGKSCLLKYSDIMILLKERKSNLDNLLIKYLKQEQIPVANFDRIKFSDHIIISDIMSLLNFILLPEDNLNLACLLKSPLFAVSEQQLLELCIAKNKQRFQGQNQENDIKISLFLVLKNQLPEIYQKLNELIKQTFERQFSLIEFFSFVLIENGGKKNIIQHFGNWAEEIIDHFFKACLDYQSSNINPSMQGFAHFMQNADLEIKIDNGQNDKNQVYITTVHGSKGLEAPIVFLVDSFHNSKRIIGNNRDKVYWSKESGLPFWAFDASLDNQIIKQIKADNKQENYKEYLRQLYVAMTRAKSELYIAGFDNEEDEKEEETANKEDKTVKNKKTKNNPKNATLENFNIENGILENDQPKNSQKNANCWYQLIYRAIAGFAVAKNFSDGFNFLNQSEKQQYQPYLSDKTLIVGQDFELEIENLKPEEPEIKIIQEQEQNLDFINQIAKKEVIKKLIYPSNISEGKNLNNLINSKIIGENSQINDVKFDKKLLGKITHRALEIIVNFISQNLEQKLSELEKTKKIEAIIEQFLLKQNLSDQEKQLLKTRIDKALEQLKQFWIKEEKVNLLTELPIIAKIDGQNISGRIDLLIVKENEVIIIDYKTFEKSKLAGQLSKNYQQQVELYQKIIEKIYPDKIVKSQIIWV